MIPYMIPWLSSRDPISGECHPSSRPWDISTAAHTRPPLSPGKDPRQNSRNLEGIREDIILCFEYPIFFLIVLNICVHNKDLPVEV